MYDGQEKAISKKIGAPMEQPNRG
ncbi:hypothetical protein CCACVL1_22970 [Corchorus capsularis]|uniref:Uncharacterized protein n=1 Tax=Corchorus capsularis TaxID=210143 RepID=A0A1R3GVZ4_COCAP|nr:hypothetical protein CCACVL1_22970 [Corchorus capsularis]